MGLLRKAVPELTVPPAEASMVQQLAELRSRHDAALRLCDEFAVDPRLCDAVLDIRLALRPAVPVVPGRVENYQENPW